MPSPHSPGEKFCTKCQASSESKRRVYLRFKLRTCWHRQFLEADLKTPLPKKLTLPDPETLIELAERGGYKPALRDGRLLSTRSRPDMAEFGWSSQNRNIGS
jgi:hypothetical protein